MTSFIAAETVREKLMRSLGQELPYALTVTMEAFEERAGNCANCCDHLGRESQPKTDYYWRGRGALKSSRSQRRVWI